MKRGFSSSSSASASGMGSAAECSLYFDSGSSGNSTLERVDFLLLDDFSCSQMPQISSLRASIGSSSEVEERSGRDVANQRRISSAQTPLRALLLQKPQCRFCPAQHQKMQSNQKLSCLFQLKSPMLEQERMKGTRRRALLLLVPPMDSILDGR